MSIRDRLRPSKDGDAITPATTDMLDAPREAATPNSPAGVGTELQHTPGNMTGRDTPATPTPSPRAPAQEFNAGLERQTVAQPLTGEQSLQQRQAILAANPVQTGVLHDDDRPMTQGQWRQMMELMSGIGQQVSRVPGTQAVGLMPGTKTEPDRKPVPRIGEEVEVAYVREGRLSQLRIRVDQVDGELLSGDVVGEHVPGAPGRFESIGRYDFTDTNPNRRGWA